jgi:chromosome segregation ATPase
MSEDRTQNLPGGDLKEVISLLRSIDGRLTTVEIRLTALEDKVDRRLQETRPIWEQVLGKLTNVEERLTRVEEELTKVGTRLKKVEDEVFILRRKFGHWTGDLALLQEKYDDLKERFEEIDPEHSR